jgi:hypothetical protein
VTDAAVCRFFGLTIEKMFLKEHFEKDRELSIETRLSVLGAMQKDSDK